MKCPKCGNKYVGITRKNLWFTNWAPFEVLGWGKVKGYYYCEKYGWKGEKLKYFENESYTWLLVILVVVTILLLILTQGIS